MKLTPKEIIIICLILITWGGIVVFLYHAKEQKRFDTNSTEVTITNR